MVQNVTNPITINGNTAYLFENSISYYGQAITNFRYRADGGAVEQNFENDKAYSYQNNNGQWTLKIYSIPSAPEFTNVLPSNGSRISNPYVTYTLDEDLTEGTITWTATAGTDTVSHSVNLVTATKHTAGTHTAGPTNTSLVKGVTYTVKLNGKNSSDLSAIEVEITGLIYDTVVEINHSKYSKTILRNPTTIIGAFNNEIYLKVNNINANTTVPSNGERAVLKKTGSTGVGQPDSNGKYHLIEYLQKFTESVNGVDVNFLGNEEQDANGNKYYKINKINDDNSKNISVTESNGISSTYSGPPHFNYIEEWKNHDSTTTGILRTDHGDPTYEYTQYNGKPGIMGSGWHHSLRIQNVDRPAATVMVLDKIVEGNDDGIWKWFIRVNQGWWHNAATHGWGWYGRYMLDNHNDGRLVNYGGYNDGPYLPNPNNSTRDGTNGFGYGAYNMNYFTNKTVGYHNEHVKDRYAPIPHSITSEERAGSVMVLYSPEACPDGYDHTKIHMVGNTLNEIKVHLRNPKPGKRIYFFRGGWNQGNCNFELEFGDNYGSAGYVDQQYKSIWHEIILFGSSFQTHDKNNYIGTGGAVNQFTNNDSLQSTAAQLHGLTTLNDPSGSSWGATTLQNPSSKNCDSYGYVKTTLFKVLNDKWGVNSNIQRETLANGKGPLLDAAGTPPTSYTASNPNMTDIENGIDQFNQWKAVWVDPNGIQIRAHLDAGKMQTRTNAQRYIYPNSYISVNEDANTVTFYTSIFDNPTFISDSDNSALISGLSSTSTNNLTSGKSNKVLSTSIINKIKEIMIDAVISGIGAKTEKRRKTFKQILNNSSSNVVQINNSDNTYFKNLFSDKLKSNITAVKVFQNNQTVILSGANTDLNTNESFYSPLDNNEYIQIKIDDSNEIKITRVDNSDDERYELQIINGTPDIFKIGNTATNLNIDANNKYVGGYLIPDDTIIVHNRKIIIGSVTDGGTITSPEFTNITPTDNSFMNGAVSYSLNNALTSGEIKWQIISGGVSRGGISPIQTLSTTGHPTTPNGIFPVGRNINSSDTNTWLDYASNNLNIGANGDISSNNYIYFVTGTDSGNYSDRRQIYALTYTLENAVSIDTFSIYYSRISTQYPGYRVEFLNSSGNKISITGGTANQVQNGVIKLDGTNEQWEDFSNLTTSESAKYIRFFRQTGSDNGNSSGAVNGTHEYANGVSGNARLKLWDFKINNPPVVSTLVGTELQGISSPTQLTNAPSLIEGATYNIIFSGSNDDGPVNPEPVVQNVSVDNTAPTITNLQPAQDSFIMNANIGYELSENLASGKVKFKNTTDNTEQEVDLTGNELNSGVRNLAALTNAPTLTHGKTYTIEINGSDAAGHAATTASITGLKYEDASSKLTSLNITDNSDVALSGFTFNQDTLTYNLLTKSASVKISYQEISANIDPTTVKDENGTDIPNISPLTLTTGNNIVKITITSKFSGISSTTYTININLDDVLPIISNLQPVQDSFISNANIGYELSEQLASGKVKFINTTDSTEQEVDLTGSELNSGVRNLAALTNVLTLTHDKTYTIEMNGTDLAGNVAATAAVTGLKYEVPTSELDSLTIPELHGFAFNSTTENYNNIKYNGDSINITYQAKSNNVTITVEDANSNDISSNLSPLTLSDGDNVVKIIVTSNFSGTAAKTYTVTVNKPTTVDKVNNSLADAGLDSPAVGSADEAAVNSLSSADATSFYSSNDTVNELPNSVKTAIQGVASNPTKVKALMQKILLECANNSKTIDIDKPIELPIDTFSFAAANLPANPPAKISVIPPSSQAISLDTSTNAIYVPLSVGEQMDFKLTYPTVTDSNLPNTQTINNYNIKFSSITNTQFAFTLPAELAAYTTVDGAAYNSSNHSTVNNGAVVNINGNVIIIGSVLFGGNDGSGTSDPYAISSADQAILTTGLDAISEETGRGNLKIKALNATMNAKLKELIVDSSDSAETKKKKRDNALYIILNHANMGSSTAIKVPKSDLGFTEMSENALNVVVFKTSSSATVLDITGLNNDEAFYAPLSKNSQFSIDLGGGSVPTFVRADEVTEKYTLTVTGTPKLIKKTGCNDLILDSNNNLVGGHLVPGDVVQIANRIFFMGMLGDGGQSIILEYANVAWTNVYDPNTTSFEDNVAAANPTVPLQPYNREITIDGVVIPAGALKFVKFGNGSTTVNFSN